MVKFALAKKQVLTTLIVMSGSITVLGCAQQQSQPEVAHYQTRFHGTPGDKGDYVLHEQPAKQVFAEGVDCSNLQNVGAALNYRIDQPLHLNDTLSSANTNINTLKNQGQLLSPGDLIELLIENGEGFSGRYVIDNTGLINLPIIGPIVAAGNSTHVMEEKIELALIRAEIFQPASATVLVQVLNWSSIEVAVAGAVFQPGRVLINNKHPNSVMDDRVDANGDFSNTRLLSEAIRAASGIRPDAKLDQIILLRNGWQVQVDLTGVLTGELVKDYPLVAGDRIIVPSTGCFQPHLVRPSEITPKGFRVFMSNLIDSAGGNAGAAVGRYASNIPYGTRLLQAAVSANCVGGKKWTNAPRKVVLSSMNPITGETQVIERSVEQLMNMASRNEINPYLMPNDAVACYDSDVTNFRDIARTLVDIIIPFTLL
jgi:polysaccharide export outer membrane protein